MLDGKNRDRFNFLRKKINLSLFFPKEREDKEMLVSFAMIPLDHGPHFSEDVAKVIKIIKESGLSYQLTPMSTIVEGEWDEVFGLIKKCRDELRKTSNRISIKIWVDDKAGAKDMLHEKVKSVQAKLGD
jgi:uncharacterized protein (TIGR00106 family)